MSPDNYSALKNVTYTPDYVHIRCDFKIRWLQDIFFESIVKAPQILMNQSPFFNCLKNNNELIIPVDQWYVFSNQLSSSFRNDDFLRKIIVKNIQEKINKANIEVSGVYLRTFEKKQGPSAKELISVLSEFIKLDSFAVFNMFLPREFYKETLETLDIHSDIDSLMFCYVEPHRIEVRKQKINLIMQCAESLSSDSEILMQNYMLKFGVYEQFENWLFIIDRFLNLRYLKREIRNINKNNKFSDLIREQDIISENRRRQYYKFQKDMNKVWLSLKNDSNKKEMMNCLLFPSVITTEEELRHMIECKIFALFGYIFDKFQIEANRMNLEELKDTLRIIIED